MVSRIIIICTNSNTHTTIYRAPAIRMDRFFSLLLSPFASFNLILPFVRLRISIHCTRMLQLRHAHETTKEFEMAQTALIGKSIWRTIRNECETKIFSNFEQKTVFIYCGSVACSPEKCEFKRQQRLTDEEDFSSHPSIYCY